MMNLNNIIIDGEDLAITFNQLRNATSVAVKSALANMSNIAAQTMMATGKEQLHVKTDKIEIVVSGDYCLILTNKVKFAASLEDLGDMDYELNFSLFKQTNLLDAVVELGYMMENGKLFIDDEFTSKGIDLATEVLKLTHIKKERKLLYKSFVIKVDTDKITINNDVVYQDGIMYYSEFYAKVLIDLLNKIQ